jgi:putative nucleotidyltransferase with HDIG domain
LLQAARHERLKGSHRPVIEDPNLSGGSSLIAPSETTIAEAMDLSADVETQELFERFREDIQEVQPLPQVAMKVLNMLDDASSSSKSIATLAAKDPALAAALLRSANSIDAGAIQRKITSIQESITRLGYSTVRLLVLRIKLPKLLAAPSKKGPYNPADLWIHSLAVSTVADHLASRVKNVDRGFASTLGLLHDIGKLAMNSRFAEESRSAWLSPEAESGGFLDQERKLFGADHATLGGHLARRWQLPEELAEAIALHHRPMHKRAMALSLPHRRSLLLVHVANQLVKYCHVYGQNTNIATIDPSILKALGLGTDLEAILDGQVQSAISRSIFFAESLALEAKVKPATAGLWFHWGARAVAHARRHAKTQPQSPRVCIGGPYWQLAVLPEIPDEVNEPQLFDMDIGIPIDEIKIPDAAVRFTGPPTSRVLGRIIQATIRHQQALGTPQSVSLPARFVIRRMLGRLGKHCDKDELITVHQSITQGRFILGFHAPSLGFRKRLGPDASDALAEGLISSEWATTLNLGWFSRLDVSPDGEVILLVTPKL